jgi:hypothetical protein
MEAEQSVQYAVFCQLIFSTHSSKYSVLFRISIAWPPLSSSKVMPQVLVVVDVQEISIVK